MRPWTLHWWLMVTGLGLTLWALLLMLAMCVAFVL